MIYFFFLKQVRSYYCSAGRTGLVIQLLHGFKFPPFLLQKQDHLQLFNEKMILLICLMTPIFFSANYSLLEFVLCHVKKIYSGK